MRSSPSSVMIDQAHAPALIRGRGTAPAFPRRREGPFDRGAHVAVSPGVEIRGRGEEDDGGGDLPDPFVDEAVELPHFGQRPGGEAADHELQVAGVDGQPQLSFGGQADGVAGVLFGPAFQEDLLFGIGGQAGVAFEYVRPQAGVEL